MAPGMVNTASEICDKVGHIMNYGDGWYGGVYVAAMYSLAFVSNDINFIVNEALKDIPEESQFRQCIADVIKWHSEFPDDWTKTWNLVEENWSTDIGCPDGVFQDFNIDAKINAAYIVIGLLYGGGDYSRTLEISTRCGQDSDCNPASAGGILGTMIGYSNIPEDWKNGVYPVEDMDFKYTTMSLNDVYEIGIKHALQMIKENGGKVDGENITLPVQEIKPVQMEQGFVGHFPVERRGVRISLTPNNKEVALDFIGNGFVLTGRANKTEKENPDVTAELLMIIDNGEAEKILMPTAFAKRRHDVAWKYQLPEGNHSIKLQLLNANPGFKVDLGDLVVYSSKEK